MQKTKKKGVQKSRNYQNCKKSFWSIFEENSNLHIPNDFIHKNSLIQNFTHKSENINFIVFSCSSPFSSGCQLLFLWRLFPDSIIHLQSKPVNAVLSPHTIVTGTNEHIFLVKIISFFNKNVLCNIVSENKKKYILI